MANARMLHKKISLSEQVDHISERAQLLFTWMLSHADDFGRMPGSPVWVKGAVVPLKPWAIDEVEGYLQEMTHEGLILRYKSGGKQFIQFPSWEGHQSGLHKRTKSEYPAPEEADDAEPASEQASGNFPEIPGTSGKVQELPGNSRLNGREGKGTEREGEGGPGETTPAPTAAATPLNASREERELLRELRQVPGYPFDAAKDLELVRGLAVDFPDVELATEVKKWRTYKLDKPLRKGDNPRLQLRNWVAKEARWHAEGGRDSPARRAPAYPDLTGIGQRLEAARAQQNRGAAS